MNDNEGLTIALVFRRSRISVLKLRNPKDITMPRSYYRLKVNLSKFFHDVRRVCWIFIDLTKIQHIIHVQQHISKIFGINEPFHLLLNDTEYLPPMEDVRILLENETIKVVPGSGIHNESATLSSLSNIDNYKHFSKTKTCNGSVHNKIAQASDVKIDKPRLINSCSRLDISNNATNGSDLAMSFDNTANGAELLMGNNTADIMFTTAIDDTERNINSKVIDYSNLTEPSDTTDSSTKRKRIRKRKSKNNHHQKDQIDSEQDSRLEISSSDTKEEDKSKKPRIVDDYIIPTRKHIRFNDIEEHNNVSGEIYEIFNNNVKSYMNKGTSRNLSTLLALRQSSTPITFTKKVKDTNKVENSSTPIISAIKEIDMESPTEEKAKCVKNLKKINNDTSIEKNVCTKEDNKRTQFYKNLLNAELEDFPVMSRKPNVGDIIGFKTLRLSNDYTPQISNTIIGEILSFCADSANYIFKIIKGSEEIEAPSGKFSLLEEDESVCQGDDKISFNLSQIIEPRLITYKA
ncbi:uncharacterized protein LOC116845991 [Odontomachus brunneus]|uniref:uncharacterized protein LOC116845991 n=1 Tax=Odontomachus brunneus TaxID=486640 RepID=UPI0013F2AB01|nr:uncharacterized protein LOC116845991 [Odontomachus brunneus]